MQQIAAPAAHVDGWFVLNSTPGSSRPHSAVGDFPLALRLSSSVALTVPLHIPKYAWGCWLLASARSKGLPVVPIFSTRRSLAWWQSCYAGAFDVAAIVVHLRDTSNPVTTKKLVAVHFIFSRAAFAHVVALDAESEVTGHAAYLEMAIRAWELARRVALWRQCPSRGGWRWLRDGDGCHGGWETSATLASCASIGLPSLPGYPWFADAPVYARSDFFDFVRRLNWGNCEPRVPPKPPHAGGPSSTYLTKEPTVVSCVRRNKRVYDHLAYMCYKHHAANWSLLPTDLASPASSSDTEVAYLR
jgi:hypothetical protein